MGKYNEVDGDLIEMSLNGKFDLISHGCNCKKTMGAGIAKLIATTYPLAYEVDKQYNATMGDISICRDYDTIIVNSYTQLFPGGVGYGPDSIMSRYDALISCMRKINDEFKGSHIGLPLIGCGIAGLDWNVVKGIIQQQLTDLDITIVLYK